VRFYSELAPELHLGYVVNRYFPLFDPDDGRFAISLEDKKTSRDRENDLVGATETQAIASHESDREVPWKRT
jgi:hypothetical protein